MLDAEMPLVRDTWTRSIDANEHTNARGRRETINGRMRQVGSNHCPWMRLGGESSLVTWAWFDMHRSWVREVWPTLHVLVATLAGHDEAIGWCATTPAGDYPLVVHYTYTVDLDSARRKGVATALLRAALSTADHRAPRFTHMTPVGKQIVDTITNDARVANIRGGAPMH